MLLTQIEKTTGLPVGHIGIEAQIETARGLINVEEICAASPRLETIIFGPADFAASMEMPVLTGGVQIPEYPGDHFHYVFSKILMAGRANGLQVIDGPFLKIRELDALPRLLRCAPQVLGYDGKWALHPDQVTVINEVFTPDAGAVRPRPSTSSRPTRRPRPRATAQGRGDVRRRDDRRGQPQDGHEVRHPRRASRDDPERRDRLNPSPVEVALVLGLVAVGGGLVAWRLQRRHRGVPAGVVDRPERGRRAAPPHPPARSTRPVSTVARIGASGAPVEHLESLADDLEDEALTIDRELVTAVEAPVGRRAPEGALELKGRIMESEKLASGSGRSPSMTPPTFDATDDGLRRLQERLDALDEAPRGAACARPRGSGWSPAAGWPAGRAGGRAGR